MDPYYGNRYEEIERLRKENETLKKELAEAKEKIETLELQANSLVQ